MKSLLSRIFTTGDQAAPELNLTRENVEKVSDVLWWWKKKVNSWSFSNNYSSVRDILVKEMNLYPYKARVSQKLNAQQIKNRLAFWKFWT